MNFSRQARKVVVAEGEPVPAPPGARTGACIAALLALHALLAWAVRVPSLTTGNDDAWYLSLARALRGFSYVELPIVGTPPHAMYPPLYPALLALLGATGPDRLGVAIVANIALSVAVLALAAILAGRISWALAAALTLVCAANPQLLDIASSVRSEPLFAVATLSVLVLLSWRALDGRTAALAIAATIVGALTRTIGVALVAAVLLHWALERRARTVTALAIAALLTVGPWMLWTSRAPGQHAGRSYVADATFVYPDSTADTPSPTAMHTARDAARDTAAAAPPPSLARLIVDRVRHNVPRYLTREIPTALALATVPRTRVDNVAWLLIVVATSVAGMLALRRPLRIVVLYLGAYLGVLAVWPYVVTRYLAPLLPLLVLAMLVGARAIGARVAGARGERVALWVMACAMSVGAWRSVATRLGAVARCDRSAPMRSSGCFSQEQRDYFAAVATARRIAPDTARFLVSKEAAFYLMTGRRAVAESEAVRITEPEAFARFLGERGVEFILLSRVHLDQHSLARAILPRCDRFELLESVGPHVALLRVPANGAPRDASAADACGAITRWARGDWTEAITGAW